MSTLSSSDRMSCVTAAFLAGLLFFYGSSVGAQEVTVVQNCEVMKSARDFQPTDSQAYADLNKQMIDAGCSGQAAKNKSTEEWQAAVDPDALTLSRTTEAELQNADKEKLVEQTKSRFEDAGADAAKVMDSCKRNAADYAAACELRIQNEMNKSNSNYANLLSQLNGSNGKNACSQISGYTGQANQMIGVINTVCDEFKNKCLNDCQNADRTVAALGTRANPNVSNSTKEWLTINRDTGFSLCASIDTKMQAVWKKVSDNSNNLNAACTAAGEKKPATAEKTAKNDSEERSDQGNNQLMDQLQAAVPAIASALSTPAMPPVYPSTTTGVDNTVVPLNYLNNTGNRPSVSRGATTPYPTNADAGIQSGGDLMLGESLPENYQKTRLQDVPQQGGGAGGVGGSSGGPANSADNKRRGRAGGRSTDIYSGYQSGGGVPSRNRRTYDDPDAYSGKGARPGQPADPRLLGQGLLASSMDRFRPTWFARREVATVTGPDGITGPHTNIFRKVRIRYNEVPLQELALGRHSAVKHP